MVQYQAIFSGKSNYKHGVHKKFFYGCWESHPLGYWWVCTL